MNLSQLFRRQKVFCNDCQYYGGFPTAACWRPKRVQHEVCYVTGAKTSVPADCRWHNGDGKCAAYEAKT